MKNACNTIQCVLTLFSIKKLPNELKTDIMSAVTHYMVGTRIIGKYIKNICNTLWYHHG